MTELSTAPHAPSFEIRAAGGLELPFILHSWAQSHMRSKDQPFGPEYTRLVQPTLARLRNRDDVWTIAAFGPHDGRPDAVLGWLAWTPGSLPTVHYAFTRGALRTRGIFTALLGHAAVGKRWLYTHHGQRIKVRSGVAARMRRKQFAGESYEDRVVKALNRRGVAPVYVSVSEWLARMERR